MALTDIRYGGDLLRKYLNKHGVKIHGREVVTLIRDDQYSPSHAVAVCRELVEQQKVFYLVGGGGTDQVVACARYAASKGVPYLSAGVTENVLRGLKNYFAFSASYPGQAKALVQMIKNFNVPAKDNLAGGPLLANRCLDDANKPESFKHEPCFNPFSAQVHTGSAKVGLIYSDTQGFYDARDAFVSAASSLGLTINREEKITKFTMSGSEANSVMLNFRSEGIDVIYVLTAPTNWLEMLNRANLQRYWPRWVGVGITNGLNVVANTLGCARFPNAIHGSLFFSPWFSTRHGNADQFVSAYNEFVNDDRDAKDVDLAFAVWGGSITQAALIHNAGPKLTRQSFMAANEKVRDFTWTPNMGYPLKQVYPSVTYSPTNHMGVNQVHLLWAHCSSSNSGGSGYWDHFPGNGYFVSGF